MTPWELELHSWLTDAEQARGHDYLHAPFERVLSAFLADARSCDNIRGFFSQLTTCIAREVDFAMSYERAIPFIHESPRCTKLSNQYGDFIERNGKLAGYTVVESNIEIRPACSCGGPHYEFRLSLRKSWTDYITECYELLALAKKTLGSAGMRPPCIGAEAAEVLLKPFRPPLELHIGRGAFKASFDHELPEVKLASALAVVGMHMPASEERCLIAEDDYPPDRSVFAHNNDGVFICLLRAVAQSQTRAAHVLVRRFAEDDEEAVRIVARRLLQRHWGV